MERSNYQEKSKYLLRVVKKLTSVLIAGFNKYNYVGLNPAALIN